MKQIEIRIAPFLNISLHFVIYGVFSYIRSQFEDCHNFFYSHLGKSVHTNAAKIPETNNVPGEWFVLCQPTDHKVLRAKRAQVAVPRPVSHSCFNRIGRLSNRHFELQLGTVLFLICLSIMS